MGKECSVAAQELEKVKLTGSRVDKPNEAFQKGFVFGQEPNAGEVVESGTQISLSVSLGPNEP